MTPITSLAAVRAARIHPLTPSAARNEHDSRPQLGDATPALRSLGQGHTHERTSPAVFGDLLGDSPSMRELFALLGRVAPTDLSVLIEGETGTGKELVAQSIHRASERSEGPLVVFDGSAVAPNLIESDLFGHERGAFTGASAARPGALEDAHGGTLFRDELGELPLELQQKLLRCLQSGEFKRVGGRKFERTDVRVLAATNRNLRRLVEAGKFREDLYYRLEGVTVHVPPLRERPDDLPLLTTHFLAQAGPPHALRALPPGALEMFRAHCWPGNVRELRNVVRRMQILPELSFEPEPFSPSPATDPGVPQSDIRLHVMQRVVPRLLAWTDSPAAYGRADWLTLEHARREFSDAFERDYLEVLKRHSAGVKARAANWAGVSRQAIHKLARKHDLDWRDADSDTAAQ